MSRQQKILFPKLSPGCSSFQLPGSDLFLNRPDEEKTARRVFRTKRKHVQRACDRCRVKKSKCDGNQPCSRCITYNHACIFRDRKTTQEKVYSRGFVEMLISQHAVHLQAVRDLYKRCVTREGFPGSPLQESGQGYPGTHAILDRLGLIKHAEETIEDPQKVLADIIDYLKSLDTTTSTPECLDCAESTDTSDTTVSGEVSPEPSTPREVPDASMQPINYTWPGTSEDRQLRHTYVGLELQQQHTSVAPAVSVDHTGTFRGNFAPPEVPVLWNNFPSQLRYIPAATDAACQRVGAGAGAGAGLPTDMSWPAMASHPSTVIPVGSRGNVPDASLYTITDQTYFPGLYGYTHLYSTSSS